MEIEKLKRRTIRRLKEIKAQQGLSINKIMDLMEERGQFVSESTLKKVFSDGSEDQSFRYQGSIAPIADVLLDIYGDTSGDEDAETLRRIIREKNKLIEFLMIKLEEQASIHNGKESIYQERKDIYERTIEDMRTQIANLTALIERRDASISRKDEILEKLLDAYIINKSCDES